MPTSRYIRIVAVAAFMLVIHSVRGLAQPANTFPVLGNVGIGTQNPPGQPQNLEHIHGWLPNNAPNWTNTDFNPALRISLEDMDPNIQNFANPGTPTPLLSKIWGQLAMQNAPTAGVNAMLETYSSLAKRYDFVLSTSLPTDPALVSPDPGTPGYSGPTNPYHFDLILSTKNPKASIRFATTPSAGLGIMPAPPASDLERMVILNNGNVGVRSKQPRANFVIGGDQDNAAGDRAILIDGGGWPTIKCNSSWNNLGSGTWAEQRIVDGSAGFISFPPANPANPKLTGGVSLSARAFGLAGTGYSNDGSYLDLQSGKLELWNEITGVQFRVVNATTSSSDDGWAYLRNRLLIGTEGPNYSGNLDIQSCSDCNTTQKLMLAVNGLVVCKELLVRTTSVWPDFVFDAGYRLPSLSAVERSIEQEKHLPDLPSAHDIETGGLNVAEMEAKLLKKVEELTLYVIQLEKENKRLSERIDHLR